MTLSRLETVFSLSWSYLGLEGYCLGLVLTDRLLS